MLWEGLHPSGSAIITFVITALLHRQTSLFVWDAKGEFVLKVVDVAGVFAAYSLTAVTLLPALDDRLAIKRLRERKQYGAFANYLGTALYASGMLVPFGLVVKLGSDRIAEHGRIAAATSSLWWAACVFCALTILRASRLVLKSVRSA